MGYDGLFLGRIDFQDKNYRITQKNMDMIWHASNSLGQKTDLFTEVLYNTYYPPPGFCFEGAICRDDPIVDDKRSPKYNLEKKVTKF